MRAATPLALLALAAAPRARAHGYLGSVAIDGTTHTGPSPTSPPSPGGSSAIRQVADISPVQPATSTDLPCGLSAAKAGAEAAAKPGSRVDIWWDGGGGQNWPHNTGPVITYMAECAGAADCTTFDAAQAAWFKIDQLGESAQGAWYQAVFQKKGSLSVTLPANLPSGHYLLRNEIIALHNAVSKGGAEFYPSCVQLNVQGGSGAAAPSPTVKFPGAYSDDDPGIFVPEIYNDDLDYVFPGGPVSNFASGSDSSGSPPADGGASSGNAASSASPSLPMSTTLASTPLASASSASPTPSASTAPPFSSAPITGTSAGSGTASATAAHAHSSGAAPTTPASTGTGPGAPKSAAAVCKLAKRSSMPDLRRRGSGANASKKVERRWPGVEEVRRWKLGHWARLKMRGMMSW